MSNNTDKSEVKEAAEKVNPSELKDNLQSGSSDKAENLSNDEKTSFIDDELRTDK